jgi:hypothetical protein
MNQAIPTKYTIMLPNGERIDHAIEWPQDPGFETIEALVAPLVVFQSGHIEHVYVTSESGERVDMFVDEKGALKGLDRNEQATVEYRRGYLMAHPKHDPSKMPAIYGTAVLFHRRIWL